MTQPNDIIAMERGNEPPVLYDGCTVWASYWVEREGSTLEVFLTSQPDQKPGHIAVGPSDKDLSEIPSKFPLQDVIDVLKAAGYEVKKP